MKNFDLAVIKKHNMTLIPTVFLTVENGKEAYDFASYAELETFIKTKFAAELNEVLIRTDFENLSKMFYEWTPWHAEKFLNSCGWEITRRIKKDERNH